MSQTPPLHPTNVEAALRAELMKLWELEQHPSPERLAARTGGSAVVFTSFLTGSGPLTHLQINAMVQAVAPKATRGEFIRRWREIDQTRQADRHRRRAGQVAESANTALTPAGMALAALTPAGFAVALGWLRTESDLTYDQIVERAGGGVSRSRVHRFIQNGDCSDENFVDAVLRALIVSDTQRAPWICSWRRVTTSAQHTTTAAVVRAANGRTVHLTHDTAHTLERVAACALVAILAGVSLTSSVLARQRIDGHARWLTTATGLTANGALLVITAVRAYLRLRPAPQPVPAGTVL